MTEQYLGVESPEIPLIVQESISTMPVELQEFNQTY